MKKSKAKITIFLLVVIGMILILGVGCSSGGVSTKLEGKWKIIKAEKISNSIYSIGYGIIFSDGDIIRFVDNKTVSIGSLPFEYEVTKDNVIKLGSEGETSIIFDYELIDGDTLIFENEHFRVESNKID